MAFKTEYAPEKADLELPTGTMQAVCAGVYDLGIRKQDYKGKISFKRNCLLLFETSEEDDEGERIYFTKWYNSINMTTKDQYKSKLQKDLESWMNTVFTDEKLKEGLDLYKMYGHNALINVVKKDKKGGGHKYEITSITPVMKGMVKMSPIRELEFPPEWVVKLMGSADEQPADQEYQDDGIPY